MTFSVIRIENGIARIIGTIWAGQEAEAKAIASDVCRSENPDSILIRQTEEREVPMAMPGGIRLF